MARIIIVGDSTRPDDHMNSARKHLKYRTPQVGLRGVGRILPAFILLLFILTGCEGAGSSSNSSTNTGTNTQGNTIRVEPDLSPTAKNMSIDPLLPPGGETRPPKAGETGRARGDDGMPILDPKGPNLQQLFSQDIKDPVERIKRLENAVVEIRQDLDAALPAINRLVSIEGDIQELTSQLQTLLSDEGAVPPPDRTPTIDRPTPPAAPTATDKIIEQMKSSNGSNIEPLNPADLDAKNSAQPMPKAPPATVKKSAITPLKPLSPDVPVPDASQDKVEDAATVPEAQESDAGVAVDPLPAEPKPADEKTAPAIVPPAPTPAPTPVITPPVPAKTNAPVSLAPPEKPAAVAPKPVVKATAPVIAPQPAAVKPAPAKPAPLSTTSAAPHDDTIRLSAVRLGDHQDKIRIVIETPVAVKFGTDLDNQEHILVVELPGVAVETARQNVVSSSLVKNMSLKGSGGKKVGGRVVFELKKETKIKMATSMAPAGTQKFYRIIIDLAR